MTPVGLLLPALLSGCLLISDAQMKERLAEDSGAPTDSADTDTDIDTDTDSDTDADTDADTDTGTLACDADADGYRSTVVGCGGDDCDDHDPSVHPGASEICDGADSDCDGADGPIWALSFDNADDFVKLDPLPDTLAFGKEWTVEAWIMPDSDVDNGSIWSKVDSSMDEQKVFGLTLGAPYAVVNGTDGTPTYMIAPTTLPGGTWSHVAWMAEDDTFTIFVNGTAEIESTGTSDAYDDDGAATIGAFPGDDEAYSTRAMGGLLSDLRISDSARYSSGAHPAATLDLDTDTEALWPLDEGTGSRVYDLGSEAVDGTVDGAVWKSAPCRE